jgi:hypothetical protein
VDEPDDGPLAVVVAAEADVDLRRIAAFEAQVPQMKAKAQSEAA